jgi:hypothetical protein
MNRLLIGVVLGMLLGAGSLSAQTLRGRLLEEGTGEAIAGAFVLLYDAEGDDSPDAAPIDGDFTGPDGGFELTARGTGEYRIRVDRIGYRSQLAGPFEVESGRMVDATITVPVEPIELPRITVRVGTPCEVDPRSSARLAIVWEEARKSFAAAVWAKREGLFRFTATTYDRLESPTGVTLDERTRVSKGLQGDSPYVSLPIQDLAEGGYVRFEGDTVNYYAPDAEALLSALFLEGHCFRLVSGDRVDMPGWVGLAFEPVRGHRQPDLEGVIWIDRASAELRRLDFRFMGIPELLARFEPGGRIEFERMASGAWIVSKWWIRVPSLQLSSGVTLVNRRRGTRATVGRKPILVGYVESGGEVTEVAPAN